MSDYESFERSEFKDKIAKHKSSPPVILGQTEEENARTPVKDSQDGREPAMSDRMTQAGHTHISHISQESGGGENSSVENTHEFDIQAGQLQHGISRRLQFENTQNNEKLADFSFQPPSANAGYLGFTASPYMNSTFFSPQNSGSKTLSDVFPKRMESASKVSEESVRGSFDELERKSASPMSCDLHRSYAESPQSMKPLLEPVALNPEMLLQSKFSDKRRWNSETIDSFGNFVPSTAKKKRKKTSETGENNGCKRCNCKKTKCLKLYCDCFAAGVYCAETCACQACFNKTEYEDTVLETRQQIELRNPLAFAPKIIKHINETPSSILTDAGDFTPLSGRHKRGCNCKKSKCLKKYCECYQASVGCSDGCRCEGCENVHGRKLGYDIMKNLVSKQSISKKLDASFGLMPPEGDFVQNQMYSPHNMAAYTPAFQDSMRNGSPWFGRERFLQPPDSDLTLMTQFEPVKQPEDSMRSVSPWFGHLQPPESDQNLMTQFRQVKQAEELVDAASFQQGLNLGDAYNMSNHQLSPQTWMPSNSLRWRTSTHFGTNKLSEDQMYSVVNDPELLKEDPQAMHGVKVSSPKKRRVSPPPPPQG